ncbi:uncharacterized protein LOC144433119 [Glandiceps talaboti]
MCDQVFKETPQIGKIIILQAKNPELCFIYNKKDLQRAAEFPDTKKKLYRGRIMLVGAFGAGKTSTKRSLLKEVFKSEHFSTDGADVYEIDITEWVIKESKTDQYQGERSIDETRKLMEDTLLFGMKKQEYQKTHVKPTTTFGETTGIVDDLNIGKARSAFWEDEDEDEETFSDRIQRRLREVKDVDKPDLYFSLWDSAGQSLYYTTHQVFLTSRVIYILVTDLTKTLDEILSSKAEGPWRDEWSVKDFLSFWMNSIHAHARPNNSPSSGAQAASHTVTCTAPPVIIVGTKKDLLDKGRNREQLAEKRLRDIYDYIRKHCVAASVHLVDTIAVDNKSRDGDTPSDPKIEELRQLIKSLAEEYFFLGEVPVKWIHLELTFRKLKKQVLKLHEVYKIGKRINMKREDVDEALEFYHSVGEIVHYVAEPELKDTVILNVGWLVNLFKLVITQNLPRFPITLRNMVDELSREGRLLESLLDHILNKKGRIHDKQILLKIMEKFDILCHVPCPKRAGPQSNVYYLPSLLTRGKDEKGDIICPTDSIACCPIYFHFPGNFLPEGLYYKLVVRCSRKWRQNPLLVKHRSRIPINNERDVQVTLCKRSSDIEMRVLKISLGERQSTELNPKMVTNVRETVEAELAALIKTYCPGLSYRASLKCPCQHHEPGKLLVDIDDVDDRCVAIDTSSRTLLAKGRVICSRSQIPFEEPGLLLWYSTYVDWKKISRDRMSAMVKIRQLSSLYLQLCQELGQDDEKKLRGFLYGGPIPKRELQNLKDPVDIFQRLEEKGVISRDNLQYLKDLLIAIERRPLVDMVNQCRFK